MTEIVQYGAIASKIYHIRGQRVMLDRDLADLYGVETQGLNQAVMKFASGKIEKGRLVLHGTCTACGEPMARSVGNI